MFIKKHKFLAKASVLVLCLIVGAMYSFVPNSANAADSATLATAKITRSEEGSSNIAATANLGATKTAAKTAVAGQFDINFNIPGGETELKNIDVLLVVDKSLSSQDSDQAEKYKAAEVSFIKQLEGKARSGLTVKVGMLIFNKDVHNVMKNSSFGSSMITLDGTTTQETAIEGLIDSVSYSGGSDVDGVLKTAKAILDADETVKADMKYMIAFTDYAGTYLDNGSGLGGWTYYKASSSAATADYSNVGDFDIRYSESGAKKDLSNISTSDISKLIDKGTLLDGTAGNLKYLQGYGADSGEFTEIPKTSFTAAELANIPVKADANTNGPIATLRERSLYRSGKVLQAIKEKGYNYITVTEPYKKDMNMDNLYHVMAAYQEWVGNNIGTRYELENQDYAAAFDKVSKKIFYSFAKGKLTDVIDSNFTFVKGYEKLTVGGTALSETEVADADYDYSVAFGTKDTSGTYPYVMHYKKSSDGTETVNLEINVPVTKDAPLKFTFGEKIKDSYTFSESSVTLNTNKVLNAENSTSAVIDYQDSDGTAKSDGFISPQVTLTKTSPTKPLAQTGSITVTKKVATPKGANISNLSGTFYFVLFSDAGCTNAVTKPQAVKVNGGKASSTTFSNVLQGTYYVAETNSSGTKIITTPSNIGKYSGHDVEGNKKSVTVTSSNTSDSASITNEYTSRGAKSGNNTTGTTAHNPSSGSSTQTGDQYFNTGLWIILMVIGAAGCTICVLYRRRKQA